MDRQAVIQKLKAVKIPALILAAGLALCVVVFVVAQKKGTPEPTAAHGGHHTEAKGHEASDHHDAHAEAKHEKSGGGIFGAYAEAFRSIQEKVDQLSRAQQENDRLRLENANLRLQAEALRFNCEAKSAAQTTEKIAAKLTKATGAPMGRVPASIQYRPPSHLLPPQLYTLAISYFKGHEDEKAAVIMSLLTGLKDNDAYRTPENFLITGVAWYRVDNLELADQYLDEVLKAPTSPEVLRYQAHARLWKGMIAEREHKHLKAQYWLQELLDHHPQSAEAAWINPQAAESRKLASEHAPEHKAEPTKEVKHAPHGH